MFADPPSGGKHSSAATPPVPSALICVHLRDPENPAIRQRGEILSPQAATGVTARGRPKQAMWRAPRRSLGQGWRAGRSVRAWRIDAQSPGRGDSPRRAQCRIVHHGATVSLCGAPITPPGVLAMLATPLIARHRKHAESCRIQRKPTETERNGAKKCTLFHHFSTGYFNTSADSPAQPRSERASGVWSVDDLSLLRRQELTYQRLLWEEGSKAAEQESSNRSNRSKGWGRPAAPFGRERRAGDIGAGEQRSPGHRTPPLCICFVPSCLPPPLRRFLITIPP